MPKEISRNSAERVRRQLMNSPVAPGILSPIINAGTGKVMDVLEENYFRDELADGIACFKYLEGDYGSGKTQFIHSLAERAHQNDIVTAVVNIGQECPFNSPLAIYKAVMSAFLPPNVSDDDLSTADQKGIEILLQGWISRKLREMGCDFGQEVPDMARRQLERNFPQLLLGMPDQQTASAISGFSRRLLEHACGASPSVLDQELISWLRGERIRSRGLKDEYGLHEPARDETAFKRLKTVIRFLRTRMGCRGFFVAFDEGTRTASFRRGSIKQKQAIENMLTMINENAEGEFGGVMFMYAATPDFRADVISKYTALNERIGTVAYRPGKPMTPLIELETLNTDEVIMDIGEKLMAVYSKSSDVEWNREMQRANMENLIQAQKDVQYFDKISPRHFVYQFCRFLEEQEKNQFPVGLEDAKHFVNTHELPDLEDTE